MAGEKLPGYYPLGEAPVADLVNARPSSCLGARVTHLTSGSSLA